MTDTTSDAVPDAAAPVVVSDFARRYLRRRATRLMVQSKDTCIITRTGPGKVVYDPDTREAITAPGRTQVYTGPCRLWALPAGSTSWVQDRKLTTTRTRLSVPHDGGMIEPGDRVTITSSDDPAVTGRSLKIDAVVRGGGLRGSRVMDVTFIDHEDEGPL